MEVRVGFEPQLFGPPSSPDLRLFTIANERGEFLELFLRSGWVLLEDLGINLALSFLLDGPEMMPIDTHFLCESN